MEENPISNKTETLMSIGFTNSKDLKKSISK
jgi:hypothetical protein